MGKRKDRVIRSTDKKVDGKVLPKREVDELEKTSGAPLPQHIRKELEQSLGADLGDVRIHTGTNAFRLTKCLNARAFTHGSDVYFNTGQYNPHTADGRRLLAHELTHVVQQK